MTDSKDTGASQAVKVAKDRAAGNHAGIVTLRNDVRVKLVPVSTALLDEVTSRIEQPEVPVWHNEAKGRDEPNPDDPRYVRAMEEYNRQRGLAVMDALCMFGVELIDGLPEDEGWLKKLRFMEKRKSISLDGYDLDDPLDVEFLYKRYIAVDNEVINMITSMSTISEEDVEQAVNSFPSN